MRQPFALQDARIVWENTTFHLDPYDYTYVGDCAHVDPWSLDPTHQAVRVIHRHLPVPMKRFQAERDHTSFYFFVERGWLKAHRDARADGSTYVYGGLSQLDKRLGISEDMYP